MSESRHEIEHIMAKVPQQRITFRAKTFKLPLTTDETVEQSPLSRETISPQNDRLSSGRSAPQKTCLCRVEKADFLPHDRSEKIAAHRPVGEARGVGEATTAKAAEETAAAVDGAIGGLQARAQRT